MQNKPLDKTLSLLEPLNDTWGMRGADDNYWTITSTFDFASISTEAVNAWFSETAVETLNAFSDLARVWKVNFSSSYQDDVEPVCLEWNRENYFYEDYIENILKAIREYPAPIYSLALKIDLFVYVRTRESSDKPVQGWVRDLSEFNFYGGPEDSEYSLNFNVNSTLFYPSSMFYGDNTELYSLNQPLLENALRQWEKKLGSINELDGLGIYKYGFLPEEQEDATSTN